MWYGAFPDCSPLAEDSAAKFKRSQLNVCTVYVYGVRCTLSPLCPKLVQDWPVISVSTVGAQSLARAQSIARRHNTYVIMQKNLNFENFCLERLRRRNLQGGSLKKECIFAFKIVK